MTPCEKLGYKVGDKFVAKDTPDNHELFKWGTGFDMGQVITLAEDDGSDCPLFTGDTCVFNNGPGDTPGGYASIKLVEPYKE